MCSGAMAVPGKHLWETLPLELVQRIVALLPWRDVIRLPLVCQRWSRTLSPLLSDDDSTRPEDLHCPVMLSGQCESSCFGFNVVAGQWRRLPPVPNLQHSMSLVEEEAEGEEDRFEVQLQFSCVMDGFKIDSHRGSLCWPSCDSSRVIVCNPGKNTVTCLPEVLPDEHKKTVVCAMFAGLENCGSEEYSVVAMIPNSDLSVANAGPASAFLYESSRGTWNRLKSDMQEGAARSDLSILQSRRQSGCMVLGRSVFAPAGQSCPRDEEGLAENFTHLFEYDMELEVWREPCEVNWPGMKSLVRCSDSVVVVTLNSGGGVLIHQLDRGTSKMKLVAQCPLKEAGFKRMGVLGSDWRIAAAGNKIYLVRPDLPRRLPQVSAYDILNGGPWEQLPRSPFQASKESDFVFLPGGFDLR